MTNLKVPYLSQLDNSLNPFGSCNVTSVAMVLAYYGFKGTGQGQFEDQLNRWLVARGLSRHSPQDLKRLIMEYTKGTFKPLDDDFRAYAKWEDAKKHLDAGHPLISHGYYTRSGHIIVIRGYDDRGFFVNDPYGEYFKHGYDTSASGENLHYSYEMMNRVCVDPDGSNWLHFIKPL